MKPCTCVCVQLGVSNDTGTLLKREIPGCMRAQRASHKEAGEGRTSKEENGQCGGLSTQTPALRENQGLLRKLHSLWSLVKIALEN